ncbi:Rop guanine nucleotide exchange factor 11 [Striga asiatica]|uniref:Rop guanine nucleotide exchange factor 11 n=1 Tax=Striga asiatica TaxID=4170 RepID=A0A5A7P735_STRAF|nr:Rop guanine nucleotide exchange factor 11 [Striga asiatica]
MSSHTNSLINQRPINRHPSTAFRWTLRRRRRPRLPTAQLGGKKPRRGFFLVRLCKKAKLKWVRVKYMKLMLKKLKKYYLSFVEDLMGGGRSIESFQQRMLLESSFAVPVLGLSFNSYPSTSELHRPMFF